MQIELQNFPARENSPNPVSQTVVNVESPLLTKIGEAFLKLIETLTTKVEESK